MKRIIVIIIVFTFSRLVFSQQEMSYFNIAEAESQLKSMFDKLYNEEVIGLNMDVYRSIDTLFEAALNIPGSFDYAWSKLENIGKLKTDDGKLKVFSWLYMENRNEYHYTCYIQLKNRKDEYEIIKLQPGDDEDIKTENFAQELNNWHGKIYYEILTNVYKRKKYYTLIGADFNNIISSIKTIEVISIQRGKPVFRGGLFLDGGTVKDRLVFEYSTDLASSVRYNEQLKMVVFDHLVPLHPFYRGNYQFYGPDGSFDGIKFIEGKWIKEEDVDARNE